MVEFLLKSIDIQFYTYRKNKQYLNDENIYQDAGLRFLKLVK